MIVISCLILIGLLIGIAWPILVKLSKDKEIEFVISNRVLLEVLDIYKETILTNKINTIRSQYDLDIKSRTNSIQAFEIARNEMVLTAVKDIMKIHLSKRCLNSLLEHYSVEGLGLLITTNLKR